MYRYTLWKKKREKEVLKKERGRYTQEFRAMEVERMKACANISALAKELGVPRVLLYRRNPGL